MRRFGQILSFIGLVVGGALCASFYLPIHLAGFSWLIAVGLAKLGLASSLGLIAGGAIVQRTANQRDQRRRLAPPR